MIIKAAKLLISFILIIFPYMSFSQTLYGVWTDLDGSSVFPGLSDSESTECFAPRMALDCKDQPHVIWLHGKTYDFKGELYYRYWNKENNKWDTFGNTDQEGGLTDTGNCVSEWENALAIDSKGYPHVVYAAGLRDSFDYFLYYRFWDGQKWTTYGDADRFPEPSVITPVSIENYYPSVLFLDENDYPWIVVSYLDTGNIGFIFWNGYEWVGYRDSNNADGIDVSPYQRGSKGPIVKILTNSNGYPKIFGSYLEKDTINPLIVVIEWDGLQWLISDLDEPGFITEQLKIDSKSRLHAVGNLDQTICSEEPACYAYYEDYSWKSLGSEGVKIPYAIKTNAGTSSFSINFDLDSSEFPHLIYGGTITSKPRLRYTFWDGERWNGREWSQLHEGIHNAIGSFWIDVRFTYIEIDSKNQANICYENEDESCIMFMYNDLFSKYNELSIGIITDKHIYQHEDLLKLSLGIINPDLIRDVNLYLVLENTKTDEYWFFPNWTNEITPIPMTLPRNLAIPLTGVLSFDIPCQSPPLTYDIEENWNYSYRFVLAAFAAKNNVLLDIRNTSFKIYQPQDQ